MCICYVFIFNLIFTFYMTTAVESKDQKKPEFTGLRAIFWPIHNYEMKKFIPLALIMCGILFNYTVFRNIKDVLMISAAGAGSIPFLKLYFVTPCAVLFLIAYTKLSNLVTREALFYMLVTPFLIFFLLFGLFINPNVDLLQPSKETVDALMAAHGHFAGLINVVANWCYALFYILAELWGSIVLSLAFWQFINLVTRMSEAKRFYGLFVVVSNVALALCGKVVSACSTFVPKFFLGEGAGHEICWTYTVNSLMIIAFIVGVITMAIYRWVNVVVLSDPLYYDGPSVSKKKKEKPGFVESIKTIFTSPELGLIVMLVISYGVTVNLVEVQWKNQVGIYFAGNKNAMSNFMGQYSSVTGLATIFFALFFGSNILRRFSWFVSAIFTPLVLFVTGVSFFAFMFGVEFMVNMFQAEKASFLLLTVGLGCATIVSSKVVKYCLFDPTKEMAYIPLSEEIKTKGKAAVDVVGGRLGKSGGAFVQSTLLILMATSNVESIAPIACLVFVGMCFVWFFSVKKLSNKIISNEAESEKEKAAKAA